jgi:hypothetical protein
VIKRGVNTLGGNPILRENMGLTSVQECSLLLGEEDFRVTVCMA